MSDLNKQQLCAALSISESTVRRLEHAGLPFTPVGVRSHRYDLDECKAWLRTQYAPATPAVAQLGQSRKLSEMGDAFAKSCHGGKLLVYPS